MVTKKAISIFVLVALSFFAIITYAQGNQNIIKLSQDLFMTEIEEDIFVVTHSFPWPGNSLLVKVSPADVVFVDTPYENTATELVIEWVKKRFGRVNITEINTGFHVDNLGGNGYLSSQNIPIYGSDLTVEMLKERGEETREHILEWLESPKHQRFYQAHKNIEFIAPDHVFNIADGLQLTIGDENIEVYYPGASHAPDNVVVYFAKRKVLFGGCMIKALDSKSLGFTGDADLEEWLKSVKKVLVEYKDSKVVIPGHGKWGDLSLIIHTINLLENNK